MRAGTLPELDLFSGPILAIESSCDETSAAVVVGREVRSNVIASQIEMHQKWGGLVPEAAARAHVESILPVITEAIEASGLNRTEIKAIAVTNRPGLLGALSVGVTAAKTLSFAWGIPLLGVHHLEGHLCSILSLEDEIVFPHTALVVSGGHTEIVAVRALGDYEIIGQTLDDAAGEAFDKGARLMGLGYPGGRAIQEAALGGNPDRYKLPSGLSGPTLDFSFSGLKTAVMRLVEAEGDRLSIPDAAASLQETIVRVLTKRALAAVEQMETRALSLVGGVAANVALRERLQGECHRRRIAFYTPPFALCTDNAAMIALAASPRLARGERSDRALEPLSNADLGDAG